MASSRTLAIAALAAEGVTVAFRPSLALAVTRTTVSVCVGLLAGLLPAWQAAQTRIVNALQHAG